MHVSHSVLRLKEYLVDEIIYKLNNNFDFTKSANIMINPIFNKSIEKINNDIFKLIFSAELKSEEDNVLPFDIKTTVSAVFELKNWEEGSENNTIVNINTIAILFPYVRALLSNLTVNANMPPLTLPIMDVSKLFCDSEANKK